MKEAQEKPEHPRDAEDRRERPPERREVQERREHGGPSPEDAPAPEAGGKVEPDRGRGQVDKRDRIPGRERGEDPQDTGTYADRGSRGN